MLRKKRLISKNIFLIILFIISLLILASYIHVATTSDEKFTLMLIQNKMSTLIKFDSWDVHPPFYYLILKIFLAVSTFWTKSLSIKIIFAKILSVIFAIVTFIYLYKILSIVGIHINWIYQWLIYISLPNVLSSLHLYSTNPIVTVRMYSLAAMIIVIEFYYLLRFTNHSSKLYICLLVILFSLSMYTHYFAAIISFSMCIVFSIKYIILKNKKLLEKLTLAFFIACLLYTPWLPFLYTQITIPNGTYNLTMFGLMKSVAKFVIFVILFLIPIIWCHYHLDNKLNILSYEICGSLGLTFLLSMIISAVIQPIFDNRYLYPALLIYEMYSLSILFTYMFKHKSMWCNIYSIFMLLILLLNVFGSTYYQVFNIDIPYEKVNKNVSNIISNKHKVIYPNQKYNHIDIDGTAINLEYAFRLSHSNKYIVTKDFHMKDKRVDAHVFRPILHHIINVYRVKDTH